MSSRFRNRISRRAALQGVLAGGAAIAIPLPRFDAMLDNNGVAYADGEELGVCFGTWFFGNGVVPSRWVPSGVGNSWELSEELAPFESVKDYLTVVSGMDVKTPYVLPHAGGPAAILTGAPVHGEERTVLLPSIDQVVADVIGNESRLRSLEVGLSNATPNAQGTVYFNTSHRGPNAPNPAEFDPRALYARLFGGGDVGLPSAEVLRNLDARRSVLDAVDEDARAAMRVLGAADRVRMEAHLDGIRALELQLGSGASPLCMPPLDPAVSHPELVADTIAEAPAVLNEVMSEMLTFALACDLTRVFSYLFSFPAAHLYFRHLGLNEDFHDDICHQDPGDDQPRVHTGVVYTMECFATLLERLASIQEGDATLLDRCCILATSCVAWGKNHSVSDYPILVAGRACGRLGGNYHYRSTTGENTTKVLLTLANMMGAGLSEYGLEEARATEEIMLG